MKKILVASVSVLLIFSTPAHADCGEFDKAWKACTTDAECAVAEDACHWPAAYNALSLEAVDKYNRCLAPMIECAERKDAVEGQKAVCADSVCSLPERAAQ